MTAAVPSTRVSALEIVVVGAPVPKARPRTMRNGHVYTPGSTRAYEERVRREWARAGAWRLHDGPFELEAELTFERPDSHYRTKARLLRESVPPLPRGDLDNLVKGIVDALNGLAFRDDRDLAMLTARKRWCDPLEHPAARLSLRRA